MDSSWSPRHWRGYRSGLPDDDRERLRIGADRSDRRRTPPNAAEQTPSPKGLQLSTFTEPASVVEIRPGRIALRGRTEVSALLTGQVVGRVVVLKQDGTPMIVGGITGGLALDWADEFETVEIIRLVNRGQPRIEFS